MICISVLSFGGMLLPNLPCIDCHRPERRTHRALFLLSIALFGIIPTIHFCVLHGLDLQMMYVVLQMAGCYMTGFVVYLTRVPERFWPGKFDVWVSKSSDVCLGVACV